MSVLSELDRFIAKQEHSLERMQAKVRRRAGRGKSSLELMKAISKVEDALEQTRAQREAVSNLVDAGINYQLVVCALFKAMSDGVDDATYQQLTLSHESAANSFKDALIACGAEA